MAVTARLGSIGLGTHVSREEAFEMFRVAARQLWPVNHMDAILSRVKYSYEEPTRDVTASITYNPKTVRTLSFSTPLIVASAPEYTLRVADRLLVTGPDAVRRVMIHEAAHLGYPNHDANFRRLVIAHGGAPSESSIDETKIRLQVKHPGDRRYKTLRLFESEDAAKDWWREFKPQHPIGTRARIVI